ncbi:hypothetical protein G3I40_40140 [Streptomyces sp. SID14478]|uniref:hypothetical protein n=1 Tax=Streptomyces sp. SID14478 TaxID=2706073 RepID=UPI0013DEC9D7|nr:hypothetical protein [Streptomyces sp. SID14478]NEB81378.1 hypothetical protein [Streptomyces sp. SID14478]
MALPDEDRTLIELIAKIGGAPPQGTGARFMARRLKKDVHEVRLGTAQDPGATLARAERLLAAQGRPLATDSAPDGTTAIRGVVGTGMGGLNPSVVTITVGPAAAGDGSTVLVRGAAKEGLIKQHGGRKGAEQIVTQWLTDDPTAAPAT